MKGSLKELRTYIDRLILRMRFGGEDLSTPDKYLIARPHSRRVRFANPVTPRRLEPPVPLPVNATLTIPGRTTRQPLQSAEAPIVPQPAYNPRVRSMEVPESVAVSRADTDLDERVEQSPHEVETIRGPRAGEIEIDAKRAPTHSEEPFIPARIRREDAADAGICTSYRPIPWKEVGREILKQVIVQAIRKLEIEQHDLELVGLYTGIAADHARAMEYSPAGRRLLVYYNTRTLREPNFSRVLVCRSRERRKQYILVLDL